MNLSTVSVVLVSLLSAWLVDAGCPPGNWQQYGSFCYHPNTTILRWPEARAACVTMGGDLVSIADKDENDFVAEIMGSAIGRAGSCWIGLNDQEREGDYRWSDGSVSNFTAWFLGEPSGGDKQNCVYMLTGTIFYSSEWGDMTCMDAHYFMCKTAARK